ncbi:hypothetical protein ACQCSX_04320 [Pseudarthrobacter sp. P1]|uniref:hypothetical protein n=1 Tax=Pseudarthrobacter sp. P1 TaxID=3418418 RepID=UPI003CE95A3F
MSTDPLRQALEELCHRWETVPALRKGTAATDLRVILAANPAPDTSAEWGVRRDADSAVYSRERAEQIIEIQRKRKLHSVLIRREVCPWEVAL